MFRSATNIHSVMVPAHVKLMPGIITCSLCLETVLPINTALLLRTSSSKNPLIHACDSGMDINIKINGVLCVEYTRGVAGRDTHLKQEYLGRDHAAITFDTKKFAEPKVFLLCIVLYSYS